MTRVQVEGADTDERIDNVYEITGTKWGTDRQGNAFSFTILEPLVKRADCPWITEGVAEITRNGNTVTIDYGDGDCDRLATITLSDGSTQVIKLKKRRFN